MSEDTNLSTPPPFRPAADLSIDTAVTQLAKAPGWYSADLSPSWNFRTPNGGVLMTIALRAMQAELNDPEFRPRSAGTLFLSPVPHGPMEIRVEVLRKGGIAAQLRAALSSTAVPGPGLEVSAVFTRDHHGPEFTWATPPKVTDPQPDIRAREHKIGGQCPNFAHNFDQAIGCGPDIWTPGFAPTGEALSGRWFRYIIPQQLAGKELDPLALPPIMDHMPSAIWAYDGHDPASYAPSLDLTVHFLADTTADWLLLLNSSRRAHAGYATADVEVWGDNELVAYGTQTMMFRKAPAE